MSKFTCGILFPNDRNDQSITDDKGCIRIGSHDKHLFVNKQTGKMVEWEYDLCCECGCTDNIENDSSEVCIIYHEKNQ